MTDHDRQKFAEAMHVLAETFNEPVSDLRTEGYFDALRDLEMVQVALAIRQALRVCKFFPKPVELRELLLGDQDSKGDAAWASLLAEVRRVGYLGTPRFVDERILDAVRDLWGGWRRLCETLPGEGPELVGWIKQFKGAYRSADLRQRQAQLAAAAPPVVRQALADLAKTKTMTGGRMRLITSEEPAS